jgi:BirA family biotin operon repressor/biotin-[acetyl-CoA-carboxylase] ligase
MDQIIGNLIVRLEVIDSTNNYAKQQIREDELAEGTVFLTYEQTSGRGQQKNIWESEPRQNLLFSIVLCPDFVEMRRQFQLSKVVSLGIYGAINKYVSGVKIKWPNDIYVGDRKLCGILIENSVMNGVLSNSVIGIGLNVNQTIFRSDAPNPVSLKMLTNQHYDSEEILSAILSEIDRYYSMLRDGQEELIDREFEVALYRINEFHFYKTEDEVFEGQIIGVNEIGQLQIRKKDENLLEFSFKEVEFLQMPEELND